MRAIVITLGIFSILSIYKIKRQESELQGYQQFVGEIATQNANLVYQVISCRQLLTK